MATWHQQRNPRPLWHADLWTVVSDPPNNMASLIRFSSEEKAQGYLNKLIGLGKGEHCYILPPGGVKTKKEKTEAIPIKNLERGGTYVLRSRNLAAGVWTGKSFIGISQSFGQWLDTEEFHVDDTRVEKRLRTALPLYKVINQGIEGHE